jgi:hypothetical protein
VIKHLPSKQKAMSSNGSTGFSPEKDNAPSNEKGEQGQIWQFTNCFLRHNYNMRDW